MRIAGAALVCLLVGCGGVSPDPARMAADLPPEAPVDPATAAANRERIERAAERLEAGDFDAARSITEEILELDPRSARARAIRAAALADEAKQEDPPELVLWRRAEGELRRASRIAPDDPLVALLHARFLRDDGHWTAAAERIESLLERRPDDLPARRLAAVLRYDLGDERAAIEHLERVVAADEADAQSVWRLAHARLRVGFAEPEREKREPFVTGAIEAFARYRELAPADLDGPLGEAVARVATWGDAPPDDEVAEVLALYEAAQEIDPTSPEPAFGRATVLERIGDAAAAEAAYREAIALDGTHVASLLNLTALLADQGRAEEARTFARLALAQPLDALERRELERFVDTAAPEGDG